MKGVDAKMRATKGIAEQRRAFDDYLKQGGFPELLQIKDGRKYVSNLVGNILRRDIEQRYKVAYPAQFENMANHILNKSPWVSSTPELMEVFNFKSPHTVLNYINYLKEAYVLLSVKRYSPKSRLRAVGEKLYAVDVAMMNQRENAFSGDNLGWRLETWSSVI